MEKIVYLTIAIASILLFIIGCTVTETKEPEYSESTMEDLYVTIRPMSFIKNAGTLGFVYKNISDDVVIVLKSDSIPSDIELPKSTKTATGEEVSIVGGTTYVHPNNLDKYKTSKEKLFQIALDNFDKQKYPMDAYPSDEDESKTAFLVPKWDDSYKYGADIVQSHFLSKTSLSLIQEHLGKEFYIRFPTYEFFYAFRKDISKKEWDIIRKLALEDYEGGLHPFSDELYIFKNGKIIRVEDKYP